MKQPFVVTGDVRRTPYMGEEERLTPTHVVWATDESDAEDQFRAHYLNKTVEYADYWCVYGMTTQAPIGTP